MIKKTSRTKAKFARANPPETRNPKLETRNIFKLKGKQMNMPRQKIHTPYGGKYEALRCKAKTPTAEGASHRYDSMPLIGVTKVESHL